MLILFIIKVKLLVLIKWSCRSPESCWLLSPEWLAYFDHVIQSVLDTGLFCASSQIHTSPHTTQIQVSSLLLCSIQARLPQSDLGFSSIVDTYTQNICHCGLFCVCEMDSKFMLDVDRLLSERTSYPTVYADHHKSFGQMYKVIYSWPQNVHLHLGK